jgi:hypothetical protein
MMKRHDPVLHGNPQDLARDLAALIEYLTNVFSLLALHRESWNKVLRHRLHISEAFQNELEAQLVSFAKG